MLSRNKWKDGVMRRDEGLEELAGVTNGPRPAGGTMQLWTWGDGRPARWDQDASLCCHGAAASQGEAPGLHTRNLCLAIILQKRNKTWVVKFFFFFFIVKGSQLLYFHFHVLPSNLSCPVKAEQWPGGRRLDPPPSVPGHPGTAAAGPGRGPKCTEGRGFTPSLFYTRPPSPPEVPHYFSEFHALHFI